MKRHDFFFRFLSFCPLRDGEGAGGGGAPAGGGTAGTPPSAGAPQNPGGDDTAPAPGGDDTTPAPTGDDTPGGLISDDTTGDGGEGEGAAPFTEWTPEALTATLPEGYEVTEEQSADLLGLINESGGDANKLVSSLFSYYAKTLETEQAAAAEEFKTLQTRMQDEVRNDPEYGGKNLENSLRVSKEIAKRFGGDGFMEALQFTGMSNSIHMVRLLNKVAEALPKESTPVNGTPAAQPKTLGDRLFSGANKT